MNTVTRPLLIKEETSGVSQRVTELIVQDGTLATSGTQSTMQTFPMGMISPFIIASIPSGWLYCNGQAISRETYANLYAALGATYGPGNGSTTFNLPDCRGYFLRGQDDSATTDPDAASRTDRGDGAGGDNVGSKQPDAFKSHRHGLLIQYGAGTHYGQEVNQTATTVSDKYIAYAGGNETRPTNINVRYYIKY